MAFSEKAKLTALAIVHVFETSKPLGDPSAIAVLNDGAGISYGINQFTHRAGSLYDVAAAYLASGAAAGRGVIFDRMATLKKRTAAAIAQLSADTALKAALRSAGRTPEMAAAQQKVAFERYLKPALDACEGSNFTLPLSLAVIYDSMVHGSYARIRDRVTVNPASRTKVAFERAWIAEYVRQRDVWLRSIARLRATASRTAFFNAEIVKGNWRLELPLNVHGVRLTDAMFAVPAAEQPAATLPDSQEESPAAAANDSPDDNAAAKLPAPDQQTVSVTAAAPTGFLAKLKAHVAALGLSTASLFGLKEWLNVEFSQQTVELLKIIIPTLLVLGFLGFVTWYVAEKVIGWKTLRLKADYETDPTRHNLNIIGQ